MNLCDDCEEKFKKGKKMILLEELCPLCKVQLLEGVEYFEQRENLIH